jgi:outer membrane biosynthesis protein TonB
MPHGILLASFITLHKRSEIALNVGTSVKAGTEAREEGAGVKNGSKGSIGLGGDEGRAGSEEEEKEEEEREEEQDEDKRSAEEETEEEEPEEEEETKDEETEEEEKEEAEHEEGREKDNKEEKGPCCARIPGGRTVDVEKVSLILLLLRGKIWDIPGGGEKGTD